MEELSTLKAALLYRELGFSVIPLRPGLKEPLIKWEKYQKEIASVTEIIKWFSATQCNIGIVTGEISDLLVVDCDTQGAVDQILKMLSGGFAPTQSTPRGGIHLFFKYEKGFSSKKIAPGVDIKTLGGYVVAYPSTFTNGRWEWVKDKCLFDKPPIRMEDNFKNLLLTMAGSGYSRGNNGIGPKDIINTKTMFHGGRLDDDLFTVSNSLVKGGMSPEMVQKTIEVIAEYGNTRRDGRPTYTPQDIAKTVRSAIQRDEKRERNLHQDVRDWISISEGTFNTRDMARELNIYDKNDVQNAWACLKKMVKEGIIEHKPGADRSIYRIKEAGFERMDFDASMGGIIDLRWPLGIEELYECYPGSIAVLAGAPASGKTTFGLNFVLSNLGKHRISYLSSELGTQELRHRLELFGKPLSTWKDVSFIKVAENQQDAIDPDGLNVVDFLECYDEFWKVGVFLRDINIRLHSGTALVLLQKPHGRDVGKGGQGTLEKPRLYMALDKQFGEDEYIKIVKAHNWHTWENPHNKTKRFKIIGGSEIRATSGWENASQEIDWAVPERRKKWS